MSRTFLKSIGGTALALLVLVGGTQISVSGQSNEGHERSLVGVWVTQVTRRNCDTGEREHGWNEYSYALRFMRFDAAGVFVGSGVVRAAITLDETGDQYTSTATNDVLDVNGNVIGSGCATSVSTRFPME